MWTIWWRNTVTFMESDEPSEPIGFPFQAALSLEQNCCAMAGPGYGAAFQFNW